MDQVINASLCNVVPILRWLAVVYLIVTFVLVASNALTMRAFVGRVVRLGVVVSLIQGGGFYIQPVRDLAFDRVPAEIATVTSGSPTPSRLRSSSTGILHVQIRPSRESWNRTFSGVQRGSQRFSRLDRTHGPQGRV